ncbi:cytochrome P450 4C1-like isoform X2 [Vespa crabro]|uniref:cytochrome P450 4C1-like isoform X2 n=1 Tax=Vespa crabro TaxID=7445 RepID=UPI001F013D65|nr:cytochrome P450 4C1-like isoform X2 [Vespa crabro]
MKFTAILSIPGPKAYPIIGSVHLFLGNNEGITQRFLNIGWNYESLWRIWIGTKLLVIVNNPEYIKKILNNPNITEKSEEYKYFEPFFGNGLFSAPAKIWNPHRKLLNEAFHKNYLNSQMDVIVNHSAVLMEKLETLVGEEIDVCHYVFRCTLDIIYDSLFDTQVNSLIDENCKLEETINCLMDITVQRALKIWLHPNIIFRNTAMGKKFHTCASYLNNVASNIIKEKKEFMLRSIINQELKEENSEQKPRILLDYLFESSHEGRKYSEQDIRDEINTMVIAGSDTSAITISFVLLMLATFPHIQNEVYDELYQIYGLSDPRYVPITHDDIARMKLLERVIKETLRLFPPGLIFARNVTQDIEVEKNLTIPKGSTVGFFIYKTHRNEKYWPQPLVFDPDRFLPGRNSSACFFPFSYGKRNCIGQIFAMLEMKVIITTLIRRFIIKIDQPKAIEEIPIKMDVTIKPVKPIRLKFERRN